MIAVLYTIGVQIGFAITEYNIGEGDEFVIEVDQLQGFLFGPLLVNVTPIACSDYEGDLSSLFANIPADSADPGNQ